MQGCGTSAPLRKSATKRESEYARPRRWIVPRDIRAAVPAGFEYLSHVLPFELSPWSQPGAVAIDGSEFGEQVAPQITMLLIIPAVSADMVLLPGKGSKSMPRVERMVVRRPLFVAFHAGDSLTISALSERGGELLLAPLKGARPLPVMELAE